MEKEGEVIPGHKEEYGVALAFVLINTEIGAEESVVATLKNIEEVKEAYLAYGVYDIVAKIEAPDMETIKRVISEKIRALKAIKTTTTMIAQIS